MATKHPEGPKQPEGGFMLYVKKHNLWPQSFMNNKSDAYDEERKAQIVAKYCKNNQEDEIMDEGEAGKQE